jgi:hypothetical protein
VEESVLKGSKDCSDAVAGSAMKAIEKCELPPDIEIMKRALDTKEKKADLPPFWWVTQGSMSKKEEEEKKESGNKPTQGFKDLFRKSQQ